MRSIRHLLAATAIVGPVGCGRTPAPQPPPPLVRCIAIPNGLAECSELPGPTLPDPRTR